MSEPNDFVVTVPIGFTHPCAPGQKGLDAWIAEGDAAGEPWSGIDWAFTTWGARPEWSEGSRLYIVCEDRIRGYAPIVSVTFEGILKNAGRVHFIREGNAVAVTIPKKVTGFRGYRHRWWDLSDEIPFPDWKTEDRRHK